MDLTGGITEQIKLRKLSAEYFWNFWKILYQSFQKNTIIGCGITGINFNLILDLRLYIIFMFFEQEIMNKN